jgi:site-specific recombinase XerD
MIDYVAKMMNKLQIKNLKPPSLYRYQRDIKHFLAFFDDVPTKELGAEEVETYLLHLKLDRELSPSTQRHNLASCKNFFTYGLERPDALNGIPWPKVSNPLPDILSDQELVDLFRAVPSLKYRTMLCTLFATGLRLSEACDLTIHDLDRARGLIHIRETKVRKGRYIPLSRSLIVLLEAYYRAVHPPRPYVFPGDISGVPVQKRMVQAAMAQAIVDANIIKRATPHTLRHCYATRCLEAGMDLHTLQMLLGHASIRTTQLYLHLSKRHIANAFCPFDLLAGVPLLPGEVRR